VAARQPGADVRRLVPGQPGARLGDEINQKALRAAHVGALWEAAGWIVYAAGFGAAIVALVLRAAHGHASPGAVVEVVSLLRRAQRQVTGASTSAAIA